MMDITLPSIAIFGKSVQLNCTYDLEQDQLYSIKWFHNDNEFYRYLPNDNPPEQFYHTKGLYVDLTKSSKSLVYLRKVDLRTDGLFRVEVSAEAPSFQTVRKEKYLSVYYFPREAPTLKLKNRTNDLRINDVLDVSCQSGPARPATKLQFFINDIAISQAYANLTETINPIVEAEDESTEDENDIERTNVLESTSYSSNQELNDYQMMNSISKDINQSNSLILFNTTLRLRIRLRASILKTKKSFNLRCASFVTHLFIKSSEHVFQVVSPPVDDYSSLNHNLSNAPYNRRKNSFIKNFNKKNFGPFIDNTRSNYAVGDLINVTCFTGPTKPPAYLQWFIDDNEAPNDFLRFHKPIETKDGLRSLLGLEFRLSEEFLALQQQPTTTTIQSIYSNTDYSTFQDLDEVTNQTAIRLMNKKREIKLKCIAQLSRIVHVRTRQFQLGDHSKLDATINRSVNRRFADELLIGTFYLLIILSTAIKFEISISGVF